MYSFKTVVFNIDICNTRDWKERSQEKIRNKTSNSENIFCYYVNDIFDSYNVCNV